MAVQTIPVQPGDPNYEIGVDIDQHPYLFLFHWNEKDESHYLHILEADRTPIVNSIRIVLGVYLGRRINHELFRNGVLVAMDTTSKTGKGKDATLDDFGTRVLLKYVPVQDLIPLLDQVALDMKEGRL